jgi:hypothetical protein
VILRQEEKVPAGAVGRLNVGELVGENIARDRNGAVVIASVPVVGAALLAMLAELQLALREREMATLAEVLDAVVLSSRESTGLSVFRHGVALVVVVERLARREIESAPSSASDERFLAFDYSRDVTIVAIHFWLETYSGGGGNRTRVRGRTGKSLYKLVLRLDFARRPVRRRPTDGLAILWSPALGDWLSLGGKPVVGAGFRPTGRRRSDVAT